MEKVKRSKSTSHHTDQAQDLLTNSSIYKAIWDNSINALFIATPEGKTLAANRAACTMFGYTEEEFIKIGREGIIVHDDAFHKMNDERHEQGTTTGEINCIRKNGEHFTCKISSAVISENDQKIIITTMMEDISEKKKAEKLLDNTNRIAKVGGWELDNRTNSIYWTPVTRLIHEVDEHFALTRESLKLFYKNQEDNIKIDEAIAHGESLDTEIQITTGKGNTRWIRLTAKPDFEFNGLVRYYGSIQDISDLKRVESNLEKSRQEYKALFENSIDSILSINLDGVIQMANAGAAGLYECPVDELIGKHFGDFTLPEYKVPFEKNLAEVMKGKIARGAVREIISAKGNKKIILGNLAPIKINNEIVGVSAIANDITVRQHYQKELEFHSRLLNTIHQAVKVVDLDDRVIYWNDYSTKLYGWTREETIGKKLHEFNHRLMSKELDEAIKQQLLKGEAWSGELTMRHKNGNTFKAFVFDSPFTDEAGNIIGILTISFDNTKEVEARQQIEFQSKLLEAIHQGVKVVDLESRVVYWNDYSTKLYGWTAEEAIGKTVDELNLAVISEEQSAAMKRKLFHGEKWSGELTMRHKNNSNLIAYLSDSPIKDDEGNLTGVITVSFDVTKEVEARHYIELQAKLLNTIQQAVIVIDLQGKINYWNDFAIELFGWQREEAIGQELIPFAIPTSFHQQAVAIAGLMSQGEKWSGEFPVLTKEGKEIIVHVADTPILDEQGILKGTIISCFDYTKEIEKRNKIEFQAKLLSTIREAVIVFDMENKITYWNDYATELYGWRSDEVLGKNVLEVLPPEVPQEEIKQIKETSWDTEGWSGELAFRTKDNKKIITHITHSPLLNEENKLMGMISVSYDITQEVEARNYIQFQAKLLDIVEQAVFCSDLNGKVIYWNHHAEKLFGWKKKEIIGVQPHLMTAQDPLMIEERKAIQTAIENGKSWSGELTLQHKNQELIPVFALISPMFDDHQKATGLMSVTYDIRERKEDERQKELERLDKEALINTTEDYIWSMDKDHKLLAANHAFDNVIKFLTNKKFNRGDVVSLKGVFPDHYSQFFEDNFQRALTGESFTVEFSSPITNKWFELTVHPIINHEEIIGVACYHKNITERKLAEEEIRISQERYEFLAKATNDCIWDWNIQLDETRWSGSGMENLFGHSVTNGLTNSNDFWNLHLHPDDTARVSESMLEIFRDPDHNVWVCEYRFLKADGQFAHVYDKAYVIRNEDGKPIRMIGAMQDITHRKETEVQLKNLNEKLEQRARDLQESNSELERFAYVASHDLQEPLRMVTSFLQLLEERFKDNPDPKAHKFIGFAVDGAKRMKQLINDLLEYSRVGTTKDTLGETDMNEVVTNVLNVFKLKIDETNSSITVGKLPTLAHTRRTQMNQLMQNLIGNALKYNTSEKPEVIIDAKEDDHTWTFSIKDNGIGFEERFSQRIFDIFQRLHSQSEYSGTGIGLSICKKIVERHGGKIWVESTEGVGSTFYFSLPKEPVR